MRAIQQSPSLHLCAWVPPVQGSVHKLPCFRVPFPDLVYRSWSTSLSTTSRVQALEPDRPEGKPGLCLLGYVTFAKYLISLILKFFICKGKISTARTRSKMLTMIIFFFFFFCSTQGLMLARQALYYFPCFSDLFTFSFFFFFYQIESHFLPELAWNCDPSVCASLVAGITTVSFCIQLTVIIFG
jgi:hypothetical protein